jgi:glycosyltransferase involved in cell wall biosynthesis
VQAGVNLIHIFGSEHLGSILPWMIALPSVPVIVTESPSVRKKLRHAIQSLFYGRIDVMLVASQSLRRSIHVMRPALEKKVRVLGPGLDLNIFNPDHFDFSVLREKWGVGNEDYLVGMIATPDYPKAQGAFIRAAASFLRNEELASRTKFVIVGFDESANADLIDLISTFHLQDKILLVPAESSIPKILGTLDVYVIPSSKATYGLQAIESLAMGTPIICASGPDSAEWIGDSKAGLLMRSGDSFDLQRNLRLMLEDPRELKAMGKRAVEYARSHYDRTKRTDRLLEIYQKLVRKRDATK